MRYDLKQIMKSAWNYYWGEWETEKLEGINYPSFAQCLKASWEIAKEDVAELEADEEEAGKSEEVKAWKWAVKKLGVKVEATNTYIVRNVQNEMNYQWSTNVWAAAMKAVKGYIKIEETIAKHSA